MIPLRHLIREWRAQCLTCCRLHGQDATENSGESTAAVSSTADSWTLGWAALKLWLEDQREKITFIKSTYNFQDCHPHVWHGPVWGRACITADSTQYRAHTTLSTVTLTHGLAHLNTEGKLETCQHLSWYCTTVVKFSSDKDNYYGSIPCSLNFCCDTLWNANDANIY